MYLDTSKVATSALVTHLTAIQTALVGAREPGNDTRIGEALTALQKVTDLVAEVHL